MIEWQKLLQLHEKSMQQVYNLLSPEAQQLYHKYEHRLKPSRRELLRELAHLKEKK